MTGYSVRQRPTPDQAPSKIRLIKQELASRAKLNLHKHYSLLVASSFVFNSDNNNHCVVVRSLGLKTILYAGREARNRREKFVRERGSTSSLNLVLDRLLDARTSGYRVAGSVWFVVLASAVGGGRRLGGRLCAGNTRRIVQRASGLVEQQLGFRHVPLGDHAHAAHVLPHNVSAAERPFFVTSILIRTA